MAEPLLTARLAARGVSLPVRSAGTLATMSAGPIADTTASGATGFIIAFFAVVAGFAMIWHIWWMAGAGAIGIFLTMLAFAFRDEEEIKIPAEQIARFEQADQAEIAV